MSTHSPEALREHSIPPAASSARESSQPNPSPRRAARPARWAWIAAIAGACFALLGAALTAAPAPRMLLLDAALNGPDVIAVGERGTILRSTDNARSWQPVAAPTRATLTAVSFAPGTQRRFGWVVGHDALILGTSDGGLTWTRQYQGENLQDSFLDVLALSDRHAIAVGAYALYLTTTDGGRTWTRGKIIEDDFHLNRISRGPTGTLYLAGESGTLLRSTDAGARWRALETPYTGSYYGVLPLDERTLLAHGLRGHVYRSVNDGRSWESVEIAQPVLLATAVRGDTLILLGGQARALFVSRDLGNSFSPVDPAPNTGVAELLHLPNGEVLAVGENGATVLPRPQ